ncbi:hypothetical protein SAMN04488040_1885 [Sulfitobacter marinus]|uniref:Uncharacterized protein n=1 Tax=Sulfitobacter marinus TaxID=394264 RepID=A0A1I6SFG1_9RHOB|nr:hypothetical protein SAMN04488040_1885 [Sulfitobacter marinus]
MFRDPDKGRPQRRSLYLRGLCTAYYPNPLHAAPALDHITMVHRSYPMADTGTKAQQVLQIRGDYLHTDALKRRLSAGQAWRQYTQLCCKYGI